jgi:hypothetical protein
MVTPLTKNLPVNLRRYWLWSGVVPLLMLLMCSNQSALGQIIQSGPVNGGTIPTIGPNITERNLLTNTVPVHQNPSNVPCISASALSRAQVVNPNIFENVVILSNICSQPIRLTLCYFGSSSCIKPVVKGYQRQETLLGLSTSTGDFRYQYTEQFP